MSEKYPAPQEDVIVSSRVRLARNFRDIPFPGMIHREYADESIRRARAALAEDRYTLYTMDTADPQEKACLMEMGLISGEMGEYTAALISSGKTVSVLVNEEDHLRIQAMLPGEQLERCARMAYDCDDMLSRVAPYAFDRQLGYLTSSPTNAGTGLRASVMMHLPALSLSGQINEVTQAAGKLSLSLRSLSSDAAHAQDRMYILSNQITLGRLEEDILQTLVDAALEIAERERELRKTLMEKDTIVITDRLMRSAGILSNARLMSEKEWEGRASDLRYAVSVGLVSASYSEIDALRWQLRPAHLRASARQELPGRAADALRAAILREKMKEWRI